MTLYETAFQIDHFNRLSLFETGKNAEMKNR
jgi:hypothetical protein